MLCLFWLQLLEADEALCEALPLADLCACAELACDWAEADLVCAWDWVEVALVCAWDWAEVACVCA
jgi:hypothetical protein